MCNSGEFCVGCKYRGDGGIVVMEHGNKGQTYTRETQTYPPCDLPLEKFIELEGEALFFGKRLNMTGQISKKMFHRVVMYYGTAPKSSNCIGSGA
ncbi:MAG: hypothetical protein WAV40_01640 [Microgenomates group bacterium]